ncbi:MAG TPA: hypothetical protein VGE39_12465, partial [Prosthecobacter sp.]
MPKDSKGISQVQKGSADLPVMIRGWQIYRSREGNFQKGRAGSGGIVSWYWEKPGLQALQTFVSAPLRAPVFVRKAAKK